MERSDSGLDDPLLNAAHQHADPPHPSGLLRARCRWPRRCRPAHQRDELAAPHHSTTSSAISNSWREISMPSALAVLRLMTSSYFTGFSIGRSDGFAPLRILLT